MLVRVRIERKAAATTIAGRMGNNQDAHRVEDQDSKRNVGGDGKNTAARVLLTASRSKSDINNDSENEYSVFEDKDENESSSDSDEPQRKSTRLSKGSKAHKYTRGFVSHWCIFFMLLFLTNRLCIYSSRPPKVKATPARERSRRSCRKVVNYKETDSDHETRSSTRAATRRKSGTNNESDRDRSGYEEPSDSDEPQRKSTRLSKGNKARKSTRRFVCR